MSKHLTQVGIDRFSNDHCRYCLSYPGDYSGVAQVLDVAIDGHLITKLCAQMSEAIQEANLLHETNVELIARKGKELYNALLRPADHRLDNLRRALMELATPLLISTDDPNIFWELLHDGTTFLGLRYSVGRQLKARAMPARSAGRRKTRRCLMIVDPNGDEPEWALPGAAVEGEKLRDWLESRQIACDYLKVKQASFGRVLEKLLSHEYDIFHYAGHTVIDPVSKSYALRLNGATLLSASHIKEQGAARIVFPRIVFLNGCWTGKARELTRPIRVVRTPSVEEKLDHQETSKIEGLTDAFLQGGAQVVVGALLESPDEGARIFAEQFYDCILSSRPVGEAMQLARKHTIGKPECGAVWASFVLYGDPCLAPMEDDLQASLREKGMERLQFDPSCYAVLEGALSQSRCSGVIGTPELFFAMLDGGDSFLRNRLTELGVALDILRTELQAVFLSAPIHTEGIVLDDNVAAILGDAIKAGQQSRLCNQPDLVRGFVRRQTGRARAILTKLKVPLNLLDPDLVLPRLDGLVTRVGPLAPADCDPSVWRTLILAVQCALGSGCHFIESVHLVTAMLSDRENPMSRALNRFGMEVRPGVEPNSDVFLGTFKQSGFGCSESVNKMLVLAQAIAASGRRDRVNDADLMAGFLRQGGGLFGKDLRERAHRGEIGGFVLEALLSEIFLGGGVVNLSRFDDVAAEILEHALRFAQAKGHEKWGCTHLLYGMLSAGRGWLRQRLVEQGRGHLSAQLNSEILSDGALTSSVQAHIRDMTPHVVRVLCLAEIELKFKGAKIGEAELLEAWIADGGGGAGSWLLRNGVVLQDLLTTFRK